MTNSVLAHIPIYHITHIDNIPGILKSNCLWSDSECLKQKLNSTTIAHDDLKQRRLQTIIPLNNHGKLGDYVPFYFSNRTPMLYAIYTQYVEGYKGRQDDIVYLVSSVAHVIKEASRLWCFCDGHSVEAITRFYNSTSQFDQIDWEVIKDWDWGNKKEDNDRKRRKQAEFLVHRSFPWPCVEKIGVYSATQKAIVENLLQQYNSFLPVCIEKSWYYHKKETR